MITTASNGMEKMLSLWVFRFWWEDVFIWKVTAEAFINSTKNHTYEVEEIMRGIPTNSYKFYYKLSSIFDESWDQVQLKNLYLQVFLFHLK